MKSQLTIAGALIFVALVFTNARPSLTSRMLSTDFETAVRLVYESHARKHLAL
jgi:hypothetical protein